MKLVVLDGYLAGFDGLRPDLGPDHRLEWYDYTPEADIPARLAGAEGAVTNRAVIGPEVFRSCPGLRYVGTMGTGFNMVDLEEASRRGIPVCNAPGYSTRAVAQGTAALLLEIAGGVTAYSSYVREGRWTDPLDPGLVSVPMVELAGKTMGIVGLGSIGSAMAGIARALGMEVIACRSSGSAGEADGIPLVPLEELLARSHVVSLHCPLNPGTRGIIGREALAHMRDGAILLNTARGALLDEDAVREALDSGKLRALGADVLAMEPPGPDHPLAKHPRTVITPHASWMPVETRRRLLDLVAANFLAFAAGRPINVVNG